MKKLIPSLFLLCFFISGHSQTDTLFTKTKQKITAKIIEINDVEVKYKLAAAPDGPIYVISKEKIYKYSLANGFSEILMPDELSLENEHGNIINKRTVLKIQPFSLVNSQISLAYERVLKVGTNLDIEVGYVDNYMNKNSLLPNRFYSNGGQVNYTGAYIKPGVKFFLGQDFSVKGMRYAHPLKGRYIKFDLALSYLNFSDITKMVYTGNSPGQNVGTMISTNVNTFAYGGFVNYGRQFILGNAITLEYYIGVGFSGRTLNYSNPDYNKNQGYGIGYGYNYNEGDNIANYHGFLRLPEFGLSGTAGFRIGYILSNKKDKRSTEPAVDIKK